MAMEGTRRLKAALFGAAEATHYTHTPLPQQQPQQQQQQHEGGGGGWRVRYRCGGCGGWEGLAGGGDGGLYWCAECGGVRCGRRCVTAEVEAQYCGQCLDNVTSYDAALFRHRCKKCFRCPCCLAPLSFAQHSRPAPATATTAPPQQQQQQRVVYLHCAFCRWNSLSEHSPLHADSPTTLVTSFIKQERADESQRRVTELIDAFHREHRETRLRARAKRHHPQLATPSSDNQKRSQALLEPVSVEQVEQARVTQEAKMSLAMMRLQSEVSSLELDDPLPSYPIQVAQVATLEQRLLDPNPNATLVSELSAHRWMLGTRISKRCRPCGKLLIKPDLIGAKTDFKRQHAALFYLPLISVEEVKHESEGGFWVLRVVFANPPQRSSHLPVAIEAAMEGTEVQPGHVVRTFLGVADEYDKFWETDAYRELTERDRAENAGVVLHRHLNKAALRYRIGPVDPAQLTAQPAQIRFKVTMGRTATSEEATVEATVDVGLKLAPSS